MPRWILVGALLACGAADAAAQSPRAAQPERQLAAPASFKTNECIVRLSLDAGTPRPAGETTIVIDGRHRMTVRVLPRISGTSAITFVPHNFLCDGKPHKIELTWKGGRATADALFPGPYGLPVVRSLDR